MKIFLKILNVLGAILASALIPVLIAMLIATPIVAGVCSFLEPKTISTVIKDIDMTEIVASSPDFKTALEEAGLAAEAIDEILDMDLISDLTETYLEDVSAILSGERETSAIDRNTLLSLYDKHAEDVLEFVKNYSGEPTDLTDEQLKTQIRSFIEENADKALEVLPDAKELTREITESVADSGVEAEDVGAALSFIRDMLVPILIGVIIFLSLLIFGLRAYHFEGTIWLGSVYVFCSGVAFIMLGASDTLRTLISEALGEASVISLAGSIVGTLTRKAGVFAAVYLAVGLLMIGAFVAVRIFLSKKKKAAAAEQIPDLNEIPVQ